MTTQEWQQVVDVAHQDRVDLHKLIDTLDSKEVSIVTQYVANLLLAGAKLAEENKHYGPRC